MEVDSAGSTRASARPVPEGTVSISVQGEDDRVAPVGCLAIEHDQAPVVVQRDRCKAALPNSSDSFRLIADGGERLTL